MAKDAAYMSPDNGNDSTKGKVVLSKCAVAVWIILTIAVIGKTYKLPTAQ